MVMLLFLSGMVAACSTMPSSTRAVPPMPASTTPTPTRPKNNDREILALTSIRMINETTGWALTDRSILQTTDGGIRWMDVTPRDIRIPVPALGTASLVSEYFLNANIGWVAVRGNGGSTSTLLHTVDGGRAWDKFAISIVGGQFDFVDPQNGWVMTSSGVALGSSPVEIYQTTDGGKMWTRVSSTGAGTNKPGSLPFGGIKNGIRFRDSSTGWATGFVPSMGEAWLYVTRDGGRTWQHQNLTIPPTHQSTQLSIKPPMFFTARDGLLPVTFNNRDGTVTVFYVTHDGGETWGATTSIQSAVIYDFVDLNHGWATDEPYRKGGGKLYETRDGGRSWTAITPNVSLEHVTKLNFVSHQVGWAFGYTQSGPFLLKTTDGGRTWVRIIPRLVSGTP